MARKVRNRPVPRVFGETVSGVQVVQEPIQRERGAFMAALYIRLSKEDNGKQNPDTLENQMALLEDFVKEQSDITVYRHYVDNGFSGTRFKRPAFEEMMKDAKDGKINCIIVKDLSRFGRNYLETGNYLEKIIPFLKLRFISVTDHLDTLMVKSGKLQQPDGLEVPLKNMINEIYAKDISRKTSAAIDIRKQEGRYGGGVAPYGYRKSETEKGKYEIDREAADIVKKIFEYRVKGYGYCTIVKSLNEQGIKSPGAHRFEQHIVTDERMKDAVWKMDVVRNILHDEVYIGNMVRGKTRMALHKGEKRHHVPREEWIVVQGTHEAIISKELFEEVQAVNEGRAEIHRMYVEKAAVRPAKENILKGKVFCGDCGAAMAQKHGRDGYRSYYCPAYRRIGETGCRKKHMGAIRLERAVWKTLQMHLTLFLDNQESEGLEGKVQEKNDCLLKSQAALREMSGQKKVLQKRISDLYADYKEGILTVQDYFMLKDRYQAELSECDTLCMEQQAFINNISASNDRKSELTEAAHRYVNCHELTKEMADCLIDRIEIYEKGRIQVTFLYEDQFVAVQNGLQSTDKQPDAGNGCQESGVLETGTDITADRSMG